MPPGLDENHLVESEYVAARHWGLCCIPDRLTFLQIGVLLGSTCSDPSRIWGIFCADSRKRTIHLRRTAEGISEFFVEMAGGDVSVFDAPNTFLISVLAGT